MAKKTVKKPSNKPKTQAKKPQKKTVKSRRSFRIPIIVVAIVLFAAVGTYLLSLSQAQSVNARVPADVPAKGLVYKGLKQGSGECSGLFEVNLPPQSQAKGPKQCYHPDPGPKGQDVRERGKNIDKIMAELAENEASQPSVKEDAPPAPELDSPSTEIAYNINSGKMDFPGRDWSCYNTGTDGNRIQMVYLYSQGTTSKLETHRPSFNAIAKRMNALVYNSAYFSGDKTISATNPRVGQKIRFVTSTGNTGCTLSIIPRAVTGDISDWSNVLKQLIDTSTEAAKSKALNSTNRKYIIWAESSKGCGLGSFFLDDRPGDININNSGPSRAIIYSGCWNYAEPHELMHMLGGVQKSAPHATNHLHCWDQNDVMCYDDDQPTDPVQYTMQEVCAAGAAMWRYDCGQDDYYDANVTDVKNYLYTHWNTAQSKFLLN